MRNCCPAATVLALLLALAALLGCAARPQGTCPPTRVSNSVKTLRRAIPPDTAVAAVDTVDALLALREADGAATSGNVRFVNNRTPAGRRVHPILADWWFKNKPAWGKPAPRP